jgi:HEAT repeat protein
VEPLRSQFGIFTTDSHLVIRTWDAWLEQVTSKPAAEVCGKGLLDVFPEIEKRGLVAPFLRVLEQGSVELLAPALHGYLIACPAQGVNSSASRMRQRVVIAPLRDGAQVTGLVVTIEDVTSRTEMRSGSAGELGAEDWRTRKQAVEQMIAEPAQATVVQLIDRLRKEHRDASVLNSIIQLLTSGAWETVQPLIGLTRDNDPEVRMYAAMALGDIRDRHAIPALTALLDDKDINVRYHAIESLAKLKATEAIAALADIATSGEFFLAFPAIEALSAIGDPRIAPRLVPLLGNDTLRPAAIAALVQLGDQSVVGPLVSMMNRPFLAPVVAQSLTTLQERYEREFGEGKYIAELVGAGISREGAQNLLHALTTTTGEPMRMVVRVLGWIDDESIMEGLTRLLGSPSLRSEVVETLVRHGRRVAPLLCRQLESEDLDIRRAAITALGRIGGRECVPMLVRALRNGELTVEIAGALARIGDPSAYEPLLELLGHDRASVRQAAIGALNSIGHPSMRKHIHALLNDPNPHARESAARIAGYFGYPECADLLLERVYDVNENVRRAVVENLSNLQDGRVFAALTSAINDESPKIRIAAIQSLGHMENPAALPQLLRALRDPDTWVRYYAARALADIRSPESIDALAIVLHEDKAMQVRIAAVDALGSIGGRRAVAMLAPFVDFEDRDLSRAALLALGVVGHPDALHPILSALRSPERLRRLDAVQAVAARRDSEAAESLQWAAASDSDAAVVDRAIEELARMATPESIAALLRLSSDRRLREKVIEQISRLGPSHLRWIAQGLHSPQLETRRSAVEALGRMKHPEASEILGKALDDDRPEVRLEAVRSLKRLGSLALERRLLQVALSDPDPGVREAAEQALQR